MSCKWVEISIQSSSNNSESVDKRRSQAISDYLNQLGVENEVAFIEANESEIELVVESAKRDFSQIRLAGEACERIPAVLTAYPSSQLALKSADALVCEDGQWWPRNYLAEAIHLSFVADIPTLDRSSGVFVLGVNHEARAVIAALGKLGFSKFSVSDPDEHKAQKLVSDLTAVYFSSQFQVVPRYLITQLPGAYSVAVNTLVKGRDQGALGEMMYFNFLQMNGVWLDFALSPMNTDLAAEAESAGAIIQCGLKVAARADLLWAEACFVKELKNLRQKNIDLDFHTYLENISRLFTGTESRT